MHYIEGKSREELEKRDGSAVIRGPVENRNLEGEGNNHLKDLFTRKWE